MDRTLDPRRLLDLLSIAEHGSFTRAAAARGVSQPALSNSIAALERVLGTRVLERTRHGAALTETGRLLATHAETLQSALGRASGDVSLKKLGMEGSLVVGMSPVASVEIVPEAVAAFRRETPNVSVAIHELPDDELIERLRTGAIDVMVSPAGLLADPPEIEREVLLRDRFVIVMRPDHPLARRSALDLAELHDAAWVMPNAHTAMWRQIESLFVAENEAWPARCVSTNSVTALKSLLMRSDSVSISSFRLVTLDCAAGHLAAVPLRQPHFQREICLRKRRDASLTPLALRFIAILRAVGARIAKNTPSPRNAARTAPKRKR